MTQSTLFFVIKVVLSGFLIATISTVAKSSPKWAAILTALPLVSITSIIWIYGETKDFALISSYMKNLFIWTLPTMLFYLTATFLFRMKHPFTVALGLSVIVLTAGLLLLREIKWTP